jgi:cellulose synthase/poly-beta-1,6-N-acetylglucosamine synthase-like glycosyltransferase
MRIGLFWCSTLFVFYAYVGYPLLLACLARFRRRPVARGAITPRVSFIITAYNEERQIEEKLLNTLLLNYPKDKLEIILASDGSTDRTDEIAASYAAQGVSLSRAPKRGGKEYAQKYAVDRASGEILVFSDVATRLDPDGVARIVQNFNDPTVGCVSSVDRFLDADGRQSGEGAYVRYEMWLRNLESQVNSVVGLSGSFFAARRAVCHPWADNLQSDFNTLFNAVRAGLRGVSDPESRGYYKNIANEKKEFDRKVRTVVRGISVLMNNLSLLNPWRYGIFSWQLVSHKVCRWLVPFFLMTALTTNALLAIQEPLYGVLFILQLVFYAAAAAWTMRHLLPIPEGAVQWARIPGYFVLANLSILVAWRCYFWGHRMTTWEPSKR